MSEPRSGSPIVETLAVFALVFLAQLAAEVVGALGFLFVLQPPLLDNPWTLVTSVYAHDGTGHLLSNSIALVVFGWPVARATTRLRFHAFFVLTGAIAGVSQILAMNSPVLGASGAVFALMGYLIAGNRLSDVLAGVVDVPRWLAVLVFVALAAAVTIATAAPRVALFAHFTGFLIGLLAGRARLLRPGTGTQRGTPVQ